MCVGGGVGGEGVWLPEDAPCEDFDQTAHISGVARTITKTYLYNFDPLKPHFYIVKLGFTGV